MAIPFRVGRKLFAWLQPCFQSFWRFANVYWLGLRGILYPQIDTVRLGFDSCMWFWMKELIKTLLLDYVGTKNGDYAFVNFDILRPLDRWGKVQFEIKEGWGEIWKCILFIIENCLVIRKRRVIFMPTARREIFKALCNMHAYLSMPTEFETWRL